MSQHEMRVSNGNSLLGMLGGSVSALRSDTLISKKDLVLKSKSDRRADLTAGDESSSGLFGVLEWQP